MSDKEQRAILLEVLRKLAFAQGYLEISGHDAAAESYTNVIHDVEEWLITLHRVP